MSKFLFISAMCWNASGVILLLLRFLSFDSVLKKIWARSDEEWKSLGSPIGFFWVPKGAATFGGSFVRGHLFTEWSSNRSVPAAVQPHLAKMVLLKRFCSIAFIVGLAQIVVAIWLAIFGADSSV